MSREYIFTNRSYPEHMKPMKNRPLGEFSNFVVEKMPQLLAKQQFAELLWRSAVT